MPEPDSYEITFLLTELLAPSILFAQQYIKLEGGMPILRSFANKRFKERIDDSTFISVMKRATDYSVDFYVNGRLNI